MKKLIAILILGSAIAFGANEYKQTAPSIFYNTVTLPQFNTAGIVQNNASGVLSSVNPVPINKGGTANSSLGPVLGGIVYSDATKLNILAAGTSGQVLASGGAGAPSWAIRIGSLNSQTGQTQVFANDANIIITSSNNTHALSFTGVLSTARGGTGIALNGNQGQIVYVDSSSAFNATTVGTSGQVLLSNGAAAPTWTNKIGSLNSQTGSTQIFSNDTNVTITSSNNTHAVGWNGTLAIARGGTNGTDAAVAGGIVYANATQYKITPAGTSGQVLTSNGASAPTWGTPTATNPGTMTVLTSTGSQTGWVFTVTSANATIGATYTNNANTYTVLKTISSATYLLVSGTGTTSGGTLTKSGGTGDATITFSSKIATATYTTPASTSYIEVTVIGGGGGGGDGGGGVAGSGGGGGGGGGGAISFIASPGASYSYAIGTGGAYSIADGGTSWFDSISATGGVTGGPGTTNSVAAYGTSGAGGTGVLGNINFSGSSGDHGNIGVIGVAAGGGGNGGGAFMGGAGAGGDVSNGFNGSNYGGGAGGGSGASWTGGTGASGLVLIKEFH